MQLWSRSILRLRLIRLGILQKIGQGFKKCGASVLRSSRPSGVLNSSLEHFLEDCQQNLTLLTKAVAHEIQQVGGEI